MPFDERHDFLDSTDPGLVRRQYFDPPPLRLGETAIHSKKVGRKQTGFITPRRGPDLQHHVPLVIRVFWDEQDLDLGEQGISTGLELLELLAGQLFQLGVAPRFLGDLPGLGRLLDDLLVLAKPLDQQLDAGHGLGVLAIDDGIGLDGWIADERHQLVVTHLDGSEFFKHVRRAWG